ncbi:MAG: hypothetical protein NTZ86_03090 [Legionellales bacterium]|nr:hypothetical protein [Legionellales bacterium]
MKKLVSVLALSSLVSSVYAWTDANTNYIQPIVAYEALKGADTNSPKQRDNKKIKSGNYEIIRSDKEAFEYGMNHNQLFPFLIAMNTMTPEQANAGQFVMLVNELNRINGNLERMAKLLESQGSQHGLVTQK